MIFGYSSDMVTKKEARAAKASWALALVEGRVLRYCDGSLTSFPTVEARDAELKDLDPGVAEVVITQL